MKIKHLKMLRNYFGDHSKTCHEHYLFAIVDKEINRLSTIVQQPLSGSDDKSSSEEKGKCGIDGTDCNKCDDNEKCFNIANINRLEVDND